MIKLIQRFFKTDKYLGDKSTHLVYTNLYEDLCQ